MKPAPFKYFAPTTVEEVFSLLAQWGEEAKVLAGGQSLVPAMNFRLAQPAVLIDLNGVEELFFLRSTDSGGLSIGAMTRQRTVERSGLIAERAPLVYEAIPYIAHPAIRNRGTVGGSLAHADPAAELPAVMLALEGRFRLRSIRGERWISAEDFFTGLFSTALAPDEILAEIELPPPPPRAGWAFREVARRRGDYALVGAAALVRLDEQNRFSEVRLSYLSVADRPRRGRQAEQVLLGQSPTPEALRAASEMAAVQDVDPPSDIHASAKFRRHLVRVLTEEVLHQAMGRAREMASS